MGGSKHHFLFLFHLEKDGYFRKVSEADGKRYNAYILTRCEDQCTAGYLEAKLMEMHEIRKFVSILMESPIYMTLSLKERQSLLERLAGSYRFFDGETEERKEAEHE